MNWADTGYAYDVDVTVVHQTNVDNTIGFLSGVQLSNLSTSENYNSDSRMSAKVTTIVPEGESDGYVDNGRLRIILTIPKLDFTEEYVTGYVSDISESTSHGYTTRKYSIEGTIWGLLNHKIDAPVTIGKGAKMLDVFTSLLSKQTKMQYDIEGAQDHTFGSTVIYEAGTNMSTLLFETTEGYNRMNSDGHGRITLRKYVAPSKRTPERILDYNSVRGLAIAPAEKSSTKWDSPGRAIVTATVSVTDSTNNSTSQEVIVGSYDAPASDPTSIETRGWLLARSDNYSGNSEKPSKSELDAAAKKNWESAQNAENSWECSTVFADYHAGDILTFILPSGNNVDEPLKSYKVLVTSVTTQFDTMIQELTLKEV